MPAAENYGFSLVQLLEGLGDSKAYQHPVGAINVIQTHASVVFLAGEFAYKIKKNIKLVFLDYSTLELRLHYCQKEIELNRRLADNIYLGVVPIVRGGEGLRVEKGLVPAANQVESEAKNNIVVEYAVKMRRLDEEHTLKAILRRGEIDKTDIESLADKIAEFHQIPSTDPAMLKWGEYASIEKNLLDNVEELSSLIDTVLALETWQRIQALTRNWLERCRNTIRSRALRGIPRDGHGDLRLEHIYRNPTGPNSGWQIVDCIEFSDGFRYGDPLSDVAFLLMEMDFYGYKPEAKLFRNRYLLQSESITKDEAAVQDLLDLYLGYRALVRAKVDGIKAQDPAVDEQERSRAKNRGRGLALFALQKMECLERRPCLVLLGGLPGTGKSTLARELAQHFGFEWIRSDEIRKELLGIPETQSASEPWGEGAYSSEWNEKTYSECLRRVCQRLFAGARVVVDASFRSVNQRHRFLDKARELSIPVEFWVCHANEKIVRSRLAQRNVESHVDASDADWLIYQKAQASWEEHPEDSTIQPKIVCTNNGIEAALRVSKSCLEQSALL